MEDPDLITQLQQAIRDSGLSLAEIGRRCGVDHTRLSRFVRGRRALQLSAVCDVCKVLGLRLTKVEATTAREQPPEATVKATKPNDQDAAPKPVRVQKKRRSAKKKNASDGNDRKPPR